MTSGYLKKCAGAIALGSLLAASASAGNLIVEEPPVGGGMSGSVQGSMPVGVGMPGLMGSSMPSVGLPTGKNDEWIARETDGSLLNVLLSWAFRAGWTFRMEHWTVQNDYPVQGGAKFDGDFKAAVRGLLDTTAQSALPVQPCFYSNNVLRVVPRSELCDRAQSTQAKR